MCLTKILFASLYVQNPLIVRLPESVIIPEKFKIFFESSICFISMVLMLPKQLADAEKDVLLYSGVQIGPGLSEAWIIIEWQESSPLIK